MLKEYDPMFTLDFTAQWGKDVPEGTPINQFLIDQITLRNAVRACKGEA